MSRHETRFHLFLYKFPLWGMFLREYLISGLISSQISVYSIFNEESPTATTDGDARPQYLL